VPPSTSFVVNSVNSQFKYLTAPEPGQSTAPGQADEALPEGEPSQYYFNGKFVSIGEYNSLMRTGKGSPQHHVLCTPSLSSGALSLPVPSNVAGNFSTASCVVCHAPGAPEGPSPSLGTVVRVTDTTSEIGYSSLLKMEELKFDNPLMEYYDSAEKFCKYLKDCQDRNICISGYNTKTGKMVKVNLDYDNRWNPNTRKKLSYKLDMLEEWFNLQAGRPVTLISLTSDHKDSIRAQWEKINCSRTLLLKLIRKYFGDVDYFWVAEPQESGYAHYHLAVFAKIDNETKDKSGQGIEDKFRNLWSEKYKIGSHTYGLDFVHKSGNDPLTGLKDYLTKYLRKGFALDDWSPAHLVFNALLWETGFRLYGASKRISSIMKIEPQPQRETVWLKTEIDMGEGEIITRHGRLYIPEWLDSDMWLTPDGHILPGEPYPKYVYDWGRGSYPSMGEKSQSRWEQSLPVPRENKNPISYVVHQWIARGKFTSEMVTE
jgi:hypothetical protein